MTKPNSASGKYTAITLTTRLAELLENDADFSLVHGNGNAIVMIRLPVKADRFKRVVDATGVADRVRDAIAAVDLVMDLDESALANAGGLPGGLSDALQAAVASGDPLQGIFAVTAEDETPPAATPEDVGPVAREVSPEPEPELHDAVELPGTDGFDTEFAAHVEIDSSLDPDAPETTGERQLAVGDKVTMLTDQSAIFMVLAVGPEHAALACVHDGVVKLTAAPIQMLGFINEDPAGA